MTASSTAQDICEEACAHHTEKDESVTGMTVSSAGNVPVDSADKNLLSSIVCEESDSHHYGYNEMVQTTHRD